MVLETSSYSQVSLLFPGGHPVYVQEYFASVADQSNWDVLTYEKESNVINNKVKIIYIWYQ